MGTEDENGMRPDPATFVYPLSIFLLVAIAQVVGAQDNLMGVEEGKEQHFLPQNKLRKDEKRLDAINLRKKIIAEIYKRGSNKERQQQKERKAEEFISRQGVNQKRRQRPFPTTSEPKMGDFSIYQRIQSDETGRDTEDEVENEGISENSSITQKLAHKVNKVDVVQENQNSKILPHPNKSRNLQNSLLETANDGGNVEESDHRTSFLDEHILQTMTLGRDAIRKKLLDRRPFQKTQEFGRERLSGNTSRSASQALIESDEVIESTNQNVISNLDQEISQSMTWEQSLLRGSWPTKSKNEIQSSNLGQEEVDQEGMFELRLTTAAPLLVEDDLLIKVLLRFF